MEHICKMPGGIEITFRVTIYTITAMLAIFTVTDSKKGSQAISKEYWDNIKPTVEKTNVGDSVRIHCPYPEGHDDDEMFLCKGQNPVSCDKMTQKNKYKLSRVNKRKNAFSVHFSNLSKADSGTYWCSSNTTWMGSNYTKIQVSVAERTHKSTKSRHPTMNVTVTPVWRPKSSMASSTTTQSTHSIYKDITVAVPVCLILLAVAVLTIVLLRRKVTRKQGGSSVQGPTAVFNDTGDPADHPNEEITIRPSSGLAVLKPPADPVHYSRVTFHQNLGSISTEQNPDSNSENSSGSGIQVNMNQDANIIYSTVTNPKKP
ncbi:CMRF35-like molecule 8 isoform X1 [Nerophis ophidion]|uniref:CMRF35-like molecule 8 isoform X1 n=1 Tax=Nerophis ophidion TaxID=159077 RepID=UPI002AE028B6|nr:CMRF35-like molecule 8 isoform X1 [Nerophis ophidion]